MCCCPVAVQFGIQFFTFTVDFDALRVEVDGAVEILLTVFIIAFNLINLCNCYNATNHCNVSAVLTSEMKSSLLCH